MTKVFPQQGSLKTINITYQTPQETLLGSSETLPTSEPTDPQIAYTVQAGDLPTFSLQPYSKIWIATLHPAGKFVTAGTLSWRMIKNGGSVATGTISVAANYYYTISAFFYDVTIEDILGVKLWSNRTDSNWDYKAYFIRASRFVFFNRLMLFKPISYTVSNLPVLTLGNPGVPYEGQERIQLDSGQYIVMDAVGTFLFEVCYQKTTYGLFRKYYGDVSYQNTMLSQTHASYRPYYYRDKSSTQIIFRELKLP